jgi:hypothetical protein
MLFVVAYESNYFKVIVLNSSNLQLIHSIVTPSECTSFMAIDDLLYIGCTDKKVYIHSIKEKMQLINIIEMINTVNSMI